MWTGKIQKAEKKKSKRFQLFTFVERWIHVGGLVLELDLLPSQRERQATYN